MKMIEMKLLVSEIEEEKEDRMNDVEDKIFPIKL